MLALVLTTLLGMPAFANDKLPWPNGSDELVVYQELLPRDSAFDCQSLTLKLLTPALTLDAVVRGPSTPPWVPMRAAACLLDHHLESNSAIVEAWLTDPESMGLAKLVQRRLNKMPASQATPIKKAALAGPHRVIFTDSPK
jgi:hypothetical protein